MDKSLSLQKAATGEKSGAAAPRRLLAPAVLGAAPATLETALPRLLLCPCGSAWNVTRVAAEVFVSEHMTCLCGELLMQWAECADYVFEPVDSDDAPWKH